MTDDVERRLRAARGLTPIDSCLVLHDLARRIPADQAIVEIGVFRGRSAVALGLGAQAGNGAHVWAVDPWDLPGHRGPFNAGRKGKHSHRVKFTARETRLEAKRNVHRNGLREHVTMVRGFSTDVAADWDGPRIGLLYVDGDHNKAAVRADWEAWSPHLADDAVVVFDDYVLDDFQDVVEVVDALVDEGELVGLEVHHGRLAVTRLPGARSEPPPQEPDDGPPEPEQRPKSRDPVADWRRWATARGIPDADKLTKAQIQALDI